MDSSQPCKFGISLKNLQAIEISNPPVQFVYTRDKVSGKIHSQPVETLKEIVGHAWENTIYYQPNALAGIQEIDTSLPDNNAQRFSDIQKQQNTDRFFIGFMDEASGWGVFARKSISKTAILLNGLFTTDPNAAVVDHGIAGMPDVLPFYGSLYPGKNGGIAAYLAPSGVNIATLTQHAPTVEEFLRDWAYDPKLPLQKIALANVKVVVKRFPDLEIPVGQLEVIRRIKTGEPVLRSYGYQYWNLLNQQPLLYYKNSKPVPRELYHCPRMLYIPVKNKGFLQCFLRHKEWVNLLNTLVKGESYFVKAPENQAVELTPDLLSECEKVYAESDSKNQVIIQLESILDLLSFSRLREKVPARGG